MARLRVAITALALSLIAALQASATSSPLLQGETLTPAERSGRHIYLNGVSPGGRSITAMLEGSGTEIPAAALACVNCHGRDGIGKPEGGVYPSNITWEALTKPYGVTHPGGRKSPPYTDNLLKRAITMGIDSAGNRLHVVMPRYRLSQEDAANLIAYLKKVGNESDPGLTETSIRIGTTLITEGPFAEMSGAVKGALTAYFAEINRQGGVFNRSIELRFAESTSSADQRVKALRESVEGDKVFSLAAIFMAGVEQEVASLAQEKEAPVIGPFTLRPLDGFPLNRYVFYLYPGLADQARALATFVSNKQISKNTQAAVIHSSDNLARDAAEAVRERCSALGWNGVEKIEIADSQFNFANLARRLSEKSTGLVFFLLPGQAQRSLIEQAQKLGWKPVYLIPGAFADGWVFDAAIKDALQVYLSLPSSPSDQSAEAVAEYNKLAQSYGLPSRHLASQLAALASAKILVEGLRRAGRDVSRQKLVEALEGFFRFETGLAPPLTFNINQRVGSPGVYVFTIDSKAGRLVPVSNPQERD